MTYVELIQERRAEAFDQRNTVALSNLVIEVLRQYEALLASITCKCGHATTEHADGSPIYSTDCNNCNCMWFEQ